MIVFRGEEINITGTHVSRSCGHRHPVKRNHSALYRFCSKILSGTPSAACIRNACKHIVIAVLALLPAQSQISRMGIFVQGPAPCCGIPYAKGKIILKIMCGNIIALAVHLIRNGQIPVITVCPIVHKLRGPNICLFCSRVKIRCTCPCILVNLCLNCSTVYQGRSYRLRMLVAGLIGLLCNHNFRKLCQRVNVRFQEIRHILHHIACLQSKRIGHTVRQTDICGPCIGTHLRKIIELRGNTPCCSVNLCFHRRAVAHDNINRSRMYNLRYRVDFSLCLLFHNRHR